MKKATLRPDFSIFKRVPPKIAADVIYSPVAFAFLCVMWNMPPEANTGKTVHTPVYSVPPPGPAEIVKVLACARTHIPVARLSGNACNFFETAEASFRFRPAQTGEVAAAVLTQ